MAAAEHQDGLPAEDDDLLRRVFDRVTPPSRRRPRRADVVTYWVRVELNGTRPPLWRRLGLASDLFLHDLHDIVQIAFGWTDSHLHRFEVGGGDLDVPEHEVRLDEVLVDVGDKVFYNYDFGYDWWHTIKLEAVLARDDAAPRAVCIAGRRPGPAEDCGGVHGYELIVAAIDPTHPDHSAAAAEYARYFGVDADPALFAPTPFDLDGINKTLAN